MNSMINFIGYLIVSLIIIVLVIKNFTLQKKFNESVRALFQSYIDKTIVENATKSILIDANLEKPFEKDVQENFITFLNQSREWAFKYIEDVQLAINTFFDKVDPVIEYHNRVGSAISLEPWKGQLDEISLAVKELKAVMPTKD